MTEQKKLPVWYLEGPFYRYVEDVKALARKAGLRIIDASVTDDRAGAADEKTLPKVTLKPEYDPEHKAAEALAAQLAAKAPVKK